MTKTPKQGEPRAERHEHHIHQEKSKGEWAFEIIVGLMVAGTLAATSVAAYWTSRQWSVADDTERRQLRAYVGMTPGDIEDFGIAGKQRVRFIRKNYGSTPAYDVGFSAVGFGTIKIGEPINTGPTGCGFSPKKGLGLITMFPSVELPWTVIMGGPVASPEEIQLVKSGDRQFVYWGTACYRDTFGVSHFTHYCWMYKGSSMTAKDADACLGHNDSD